MTKEEQSQSQETPKSTEDLEPVPHHKFDEVMDGLNAVAQTTEGPLESHPDKFGPLAPADADMGIALQHEGLSPAVLARKLRILLESSEPKWNHKTKGWDYFIPSELWRRCIEMIMKVRGDYAPEKRINIEIDGTLEELLMASKGMTPEEAREKIVDYIDVEVIKEKE